VNNENLDLLNKSKTPGHCGFFLANPQRGPMTDFVSPKVLEDRQDIEYYINESSICTKHKFDQK
jgi:hypothetical protein